jgi:hypothetical protein
LSSFKFSDETTIFSPVDETIEAALGFAIIAALKAAY